jgi:4-hydroxybenzoate polyprenyltransferase
MDFIRDLGRQALLYGQLMRLHRPIGLWLLLWPTLWGLWLCSAGRPSPKLFLVFVAGVLVMRSAGCVINDFADRNLDAKVRRTRDRPLATGAVTAPEALALFAILGLVALALLAQLNSLTQLVAVGAGALTILYPFTKRFFSAPQVVLGAAFGWSIPMAWAAQTESVPRVAWLWWLTVVIWAVIYDTIYAMADRDDDRRAGVKSTALLFGSLDLLVLGFLMLLLLVGLMLAGRESGLGVWYAAAVAAGGLQLLWQHRLIRQRDPARCLQAFQANQLFGATIFAGIVLEFTFRSP